VKRKSNKRSKKPHFHPAAFPHGFYSKKPYYGHTRYAFERLERKEAR